jgi:redox-sensitive bicupin YhaK (pirin superfamily)
MEVPMLQLRPSSTLDGGDFGWPKAKHHFAVSPGFQISLRPRVNGREPRWSTRRFPKTDRANQLVVPASGTPDDIDAIPTGADGRVLGATLFAGAQRQYELGDFRHAYLVPTRGSIEVNGIYLGMGDGIAVRDESHLTVSASEDAEIVLVPTA